MLATSSQLLWYTTRATGVVALLLLTATVFLGVLTSVRFGSPLWPRFALQDLHKRISLLAMGFLAIHIGTAVSDPFAPIGWISVLVPFTSSYRRLWLSFGTVAFDLLLAVVITSLLRHRINQRLWRGIHWLAYASWPVALVHGLGTGTDPHLGWMMFLTIGCVTTVLIAIGWRLVEGWPTRALRRLGAGVGSLVAVLAIAAWTASGPLRPGWAARAGTPTNLLAHPASLSSPSGSSTSGGTSAAGSGTSSGSASGTTPASGSSQLPTPPYSADFSGSISQQTQGSGLVQVAMKAQTQGSLDAILQVVITGSPDGSGGVVMQQSTASFGAPGSPSQYQGQIAALDGSRIVLSLQDSSGNVLELRLDVSISGSSLSGRLVSVSAGQGQGGFGDSQ